MPFSLFSHTKTRVSSFIVIYIPCFEINKSDLSMKINHRSGDMISIETYDEHSAASVIDLSYLFQYALET